MAKSGRGTISPGRLFAFSAMERLEVDQAFSSFLLSSEEFRLLPVQERGFAHELILGVLRHQQSLDAVINQCVSKKNLSLQPEVRRLLRLGLYQLLYMDRVPPFAAVSQTVSICKRCIGMSPQGLINAVLRRVSSELAYWRDHIKQPPRKDVASIAIQFSHPEWLVSRWLERFGWQQTITLLQSNNLPPRRDFRVHLQDPLVERCLDSLKEAGHIYPLDFPEGAYAVATGSRKLKNNSAFSQLEPYIHWQSRASQCIPFLLPLPTGKNLLLDACAAPGGKTLTLSRRMGVNGKVIALDRYSKRLVPLNLAAKSQLFSNIHTVCADSLGSLPFPRHILFPSILLDAPCTGIGTLCRHPEIRLRVLPEDPLRLQQTQLKILNTVSKITAPGGFILYSTCSTEPEENEEVIFIFLKGQKQFICQRPSSIGLLSEWLDEHGFFRTYPSHPGEEGFFAALLFRQY